MLAGEGKLSEWFSFEMGSDGLDVVSFPPGLDLLLNKCPQSPPAKQRHPGNW